MKEIILLSIVFLLAIQCTTQKRPEGNLSDSLSADTTEAGDGIPESDGHMESGDTLSLAIEAALDDLASQSLETCPYTVSSKYSGYESQTDWTYYFDSALTLRYAVVSWDMEGTSGNSTYYFEHDQLVAGREENSFNDYEEIVAFHSKFKPVYGYSITNGTENDSMPTYLYEADYISKNSDATSNYQQVLDRIIEYSDTVVVAGDYVTIHIENIVNYGDDVTETEDYRVSRVVFDKLIKQ